MDDRARVPSIDLALLTDAVARWQALVRARREQFERLRVEPADPGAYWRTRSRNYYSAVRQRTEPDPFVRAVLEACREAESRDDAAQGDRGGATAGHGPGRGRGVRSSRACPSRSAAVA